MPPQPLPQSRFHLGLDLGLRRNPTALALLDEITRPTGEFDHARYVPITETVLILRDIRPFPLETPYARIASILSSYLQLLPHAAKVRLAVDATGVGAPVVELLTRANLPVTLQPIVITAGQSVAHLPHATSVPRDALLQNLRIQLECTALRIPAALTHRPALQDELTALGVRPSHPDDLAFALALALWSARPNPYIGERPDPLPGAPFRSR